jgi:hypothetical protein
VVRDFVLMLYSQARMPFGLGPDPEVLRDEIDSQAWFLRMISVELSPYLISSTPLSMNL